MHQSRWTLQSCLENLRRRLPPDEPKLIADGPSNIWISAAFGLALISLVIFVW